MPINNPCFSSVPQIRINWSALSSVLPQLFRCECLLSLVRSWPGVCSTERWRCRLLRAAAGTAGVFLPPLSAHVRPREPWREGLTDWRWGLRRPGWGLGWGRGLLLPTHHPGLPVRGQGSPGACGHLPPEEELAGTWGGWTRLTWQWFRRRVGFFGTGSWIW